jgi:hypothetical protein
MKNIFDLTGIGSPQINQIHIEQPICHCRIQMNNSFFPQDNATFPMAGLSNFISINKLNKYRILSRGAKSLMQRLRPFAEILPIMHIRKTLHIILGLIKHHAWIII